MSKLDDLQKILSTYTKCHINDPSIIWLLLGTDYYYIEKYGVKGILDVEERQRGCLGAMGKAFIEMLNNLVSNNSLNIRTSKSIEQQHSCVQKIEARLLNYHKLCTENVNFSDETDNNPGEYRQTDISSYTLQLNTENSNATKLGYAYLNSRHAIRGPKIDNKVTYIENFYGIANNLDNSYKIICTSKNIEIKNIVNKLILRLVQDLGGDLTDNENLLNISMFIQDMIILRPFSRSNTKTLVGLLLNEILVDIGFIPTVFRNKSIFMGFTPHELVFEIGKGQKILQGIVSNFDSIVCKLQERCRAMLAVTLRTDSPELLEIGMLHLKVPNSFKSKLSNAVLTFDRGKKSLYHTELLHDKIFLDHFVRVYGSQSHVVFAAAVILVSLLNDNTSGHQSWHLHFLIECFFKYKIEERTIVNGYFHALAFITFEENVDPVNCDLLDKLFRDGGSGHTLYKHSEDKMYIILSCIDWYANLKGLSTTTRKSIDNLTAMLNDSPGNKKFNYGEQRKIKIRIDNVFNQTRPRYYSM